LKILSILSISFLIFANGCVSSVVYNRHQESQSRKAIVHSNDPDAMRLMHIGVKPSNVIRIQSLNNDEFAIMASVTDAGDFWEYFKENKGKAILSMATDAALAYGAYIVGDNNNWFRSSEKIEVNIHGDYNEVHINNNRIDAKDDNDGTSGQEQRP
jgi:hypothetical protein